LTRMPISPYHLFNLNLNS